MTRLLIIALVLAAAVGRAGQLPTAPSVSPAEALHRADEYVHKQFPQFADIYCSEMIYEPAVEACVKDPQLLWRFRYLLPNNPGAASTIPNNPWPDYGVCLVYMRVDGTLYHTTQPKRNTK